MNSKQVRKQSSQKSWKCVNTLWAFVCFVATVSTIMWQLLNFINGRDATIVLYKTFNKEKIDVYPSIGMCFSMAFDEKKLQSYGNKMSKLAYSAFLAGSGNGLTRKMFQVDHEKVSLSFDSFIGKYGVTTNNWKDIVLYDALSSKSNETLYERPEFKIHDIFGVKCFSIDMPYIRGQKLARAYVSLSTDIFPSGIRPSLGENPLGDDMFMVAPHYPNQLYRQLNVGQRFWTVRDQNASKAYIMDFNIRNLEILEHRNKYYDPCIEDIPNFDAQIPTWVMEKIGCKPSYWKSLNVSGPSCSTFEQMTNARSLLFSVVFGTLEEANYTKTLPCRSLEKIQYDVRDIDLPTGENQSFVTLNFNFREFTYKEVKDVRSMDVQALIGIYSLAKLIIQYIKINYILM